MNRTKSIAEISGTVNIDGVVPGIRGQRAFPTAQLNYADPFIMLDHIGPQKLHKDFKVDGHAHPHRGFETITFMFEGQMDHVDSQGNALRLDSGSVQAMNAGSGILHGGDMMPDPESQVFNEIQLWVNLPAKDKMSDPTVRNAAAEEIPNIELDGASVRVITGEAFGEKAALQTGVQTRILHVTNQKKQTLTIPEIPQNYSTYLYVLRGTLTVEEESVEAFQTVRFNNDGDSITVLAESNCEFLMLSGEPLEEPVAFGGPFVMNTQEEIQQAQHDYASGAFGTIN